MNEEVKLQILNKIKEYDKIFISRHFRPDGDAIGSTRGMLGLIKNTWPEKKVYLQNDDMCEYVRFLGEEPEIFSDEEYKDALMIVIDTATVDRISNKKYELCKELIKIDHHIDNNPYGDIFWVEDWRSSACEMIADFYATFKDELKMDKETATAIYTGMVTDSGRFRYSATNGETMRMAGLLLDFGVDIETLYAHLYLDDYDQLKFKAYIYDKMQITESGLVYIYVDHEMQEKFHLTSEEASNVIGALSDIKGSLMWLAFIDNPPKEGEPESTRVRLRSRFMTCNELAEKYHGGGHDRASGATVYSSEEMQALIADADRMVKEYKENNTGWL